MALKTSLSIIINAGNEQDVIAECLKSATFANEIVFVAANSSDQTVEIAKKLIPKIKIIEITDEYGKNFAKWHNIGLQNATKNWVFHLDADERISPLLQHEIIETINHPQSNYYAVPRANHYLGKRVRYGGSYPDYVKRLFCREKLVEWTGRIHEEPTIDGPIGYIKNDLLHYTHRHLTSMLQKTLLWTEVEAQALYHSHHPPIVWWRIFRMMITKLWERLIAQQMWRDGTVGYISVLFEVFDTFIIYARLWELQQFNNT